MSEAISSAQAIAPLAALLAERGIARVVHLHVDHFEPFRQDRSGAVIGREHVSEFLRRIKALPFAAPATLLLSSYAYARVPDSSLERRLARGDLLVHAEGDPWYFTPSSYVDDERRILEMLGERSAGLGGGGFGIHVHHEHWCSGPVTKTPADPALDSRRLDFYLSLILPHYRQHTGLPLVRWPFVHGCWALQGSDAEICCIEDEIAVLQRHGCVADLTFPAGRPWCDAAMKQPHSVLPVAGRKAYDTPAAQPLPLQPGVPVPPGRFVLWSAPIPSSHVSLEAVAKREHKPAVLLCSWLDRLPVYLSLDAPSAGGTLYVKTHCHSMWWERWASVANTDTPLLSEPVAEVFGLLQRVCDAAHVELRFATAQDALAELGVSP